MSKEGAPKNIYISNEGDETCTRLMNKEYVGTALEAYRLAIAVALARELEPNTAIDRPKNKWDTSSVFSDEGTRIDLLMKVHGFDGDEVVVQGIALAEAGLEFLNEKMNRDVDIWKILGDTDPMDSPQNTKTRN